MKDADYNYNSWLLDEVRYRAAKASPQWKAIYDAADDRILSRLMRIHEEAAANYCRYCRRDRCACDEAYDAWRDDR